jgi:hypothetical protein
MQWRDVMAGKFWMAGGALVLLGLLMMAFGGQETGGLLDYRAWLLTILGVLAVVIGNFHAMTRRES